MFLSTVQHHDKREVDSMCKRCKWLNLDNPKYVEYHDMEWGKAHYEDSYFYEMLVLETFQAGLSWECILNKREAFREAFEDFDYTKVAKYAQDKIEELMGNKGIVRNRLKINAAIQNAKIFMDIQKEYGKFSDYIWSFTNGTQIVNDDGIPRATSELSDKVSKDLKKRGMKFVGSTIMYSYLQAVGVINDHEKACDFAG